MATIGWMLWIHDRIYCAGVKKKIFYPKPDVMKMILKYKGKVVYEKEMKV